MWHFSQRTIAIVISGENNSYKLPHETEYRIGKKAVVMFYASRDLFLNQSLRLSSVFVLPRMEKDDLPYSRLSTRRAISESNKSAVLLLKRPTYIEK